MPRLKDRWRSLAYALPGVERSYHRLHFLFWRERIRRRSRTTMHGLIDPHRTLWVDPRDIRLACVWGPERYRKFHDRGLVVDGSWDTDVEAFESLDVYRGLREHFVEGRPWDETDYYQRVRAQVLGGHHKRGMTTADDVDARCAELDRLYRRIRDDGYRTLDRVSDRPLPWTGPEDEVSVRIGREGDLLFEDGRHRLAMAKILGVERIPVKVTVRHRAWFDFVMEIHDYAREHGGMVDTTPSHPDLDDIPARRGREWFGRIAKQLPVSSGAALEIGCGWGAHLHQLEGMGFECTGVESDARDFYFAEKLRRADRRSFELVNGSVLDYRERTRFDLVLALFAFDRSANSTTEHRRLVELLGRLEMGAMVIGCSDAGQAARASALRDHAPHELVDVVLEHSNLTRVRRLEIEDGRGPIYLLEA